MDSDDEENFERLWARADLRERDRLAVIRAIQEDDVGELYT